jgi:hypothetical protein
MSALKAFYVVSLSCAVTVFIGWRVHTVRTRRAPHYEILKDRSLSDADGCESVVGIAKGIFRMGNNEPKSTVNVLVTGDTETANEPRQIGRYTIPVSHKALEGKNVIEGQQEEILEDVSRKCQAAGRTNISPILLGVTAAIADLRAEGCGQTSHCQLYVDSDLEENADASIKRSLSVGRMQMQSPVIDNGAIGITFCGIVETHGRSAGGQFAQMLGARYQLRKNVWISLFTQPGNVSFEPYCF